MERDKHHDNGRADKKGPHPGTSTVPRVARRPRFTGTRKIVARDAKRVDLARAPADLEREAGATDDRSF
jgi:hypothetical protein